MTVFFGLVFDEISGGMMKNVFDVVMLRYFGGALIFAWLLLELWSVITLRNHKTTIWPHYAATCLVVEGPYKFTRNPMYIAHVTFTLGIALLVASPFMTLFTPLLAYGEQKLAVEPEERHLTEKFGDAFRVYMAQTPRWFWHGK
jgi:protein-S-isoprenylcysteine O-methyltransferase Ste14